MEATVLEQAREEVIRRHGPWTAHNIHLGEGVYTIGKDAEGNGVKLRRVVQIIADVAGKPFDQMRVLDLACLEGLYAIELGLRGATVVAIEGREANIEKARFVRDVLSLEKVELVQADVRDLDKHGHDAFDVVLCLGILYHLDAPDIFKLIERIAEICRGVVIIDTSITLSDREARTYRGRRYHGTSALEHEPTSSAGARLEALWMSLDNDRSFWLTRPSLLNFLNHVGFTTVFECHVPPSTEEPSVRPTFVAFNGTHEELIAAPQLNPLPIGEWPQRPSLQLWATDTRLRLFLKKALPSPLKRGIRRIVG